MPAAIRFLEAAWAGKIAQLTIAEYMAKRRPEIVADVEDLPSQSRGGQCLAQSPVRTAGT